MNINLQWFKEKYNDDDDTKEYVVRINERITITPIEWEYDDESEQDYLVYTGEPVSFTAENGTGKLLKNALVNFDVRIDATWRDATPEEIEAYKTSLPDIGRGATEKIRKAGKLFNES